MSASSSSGERARCRYNDYDIQEILELLEAANLEVKKGMTASSSSEEMANLRCGSIKDYDPKGIQEAHTTHKGAIKDTNFEVKNNMTASSSIEGSTTRCHYVKYDIEEFSKVWEATDLEVKKDYDPEGIEEAHTREIAIKDTNFEVKKNMTTSSSSEEMGNLRCSHVKYDIEEFSKVWEATDLEVKKDMTASSSSEEMANLPCDSIKDYDPEGIEEAHTREIAIKATNLEVKKDMTTSSSSEEMADLRCGYEDYDPEGIEVAHTREIAIKATNLEVKKDMTASSSSEVEEFLIDIKNLEEPTLKCCIYRVPRDLRKINKKAYTPQVVSIGPFHHGKKEYLIEMEKQKLRYVQKFIERTSMDTLKEFKSYIEHNEREIRVCYVENLNFQSNEFVQMILYDAIFIFKLFLRNEQAKTRSEFDILLHTPIRKAAIRLDLQLLENQLPYFVLKELFSRLGELAKPSGEERYSDPFLILALRFFYDSERDHLRYSTYNLQHFTDLGRYFLLKEFNPLKKNQDKHIRDLRCATKLHGSGVKFKKSIEDRSSLEIRCEYNKRSIQFIPCIKSQELVLEIPCLEVFDGTECLIRNVMALEQLRYPWKTNICNFILLMDFLIDTENDVDLLVEKGIIFNCLGDNAAIANMFNRLGLQVTPSYSCYFDIGEKLKTHYGKRWNHAKATLKSVYFSDRWIATGSLELLLLLFSCCSPLYKLFVLFYKYFRLI